MNRTCRRAIWVGLLAVAAAGWGWAQQAGNQAVVPGAKGVSEAVPAEPPLPAEIVLQPGQAPAGEAVWKVRIVGANAAAAGFSLSYDPEALEYAGAEKPERLGEVTLLTNEKSLGAGRVGFLLAASPGRTLPEGAPVLVEVRFRIKAPGAEVKIPVLGDEPIRREVADEYARPMPLAGPPAPVHP